MILIFLKCRKFSIHFLLDLLAALDIIIQLVFKWAYTPGVREGVQQNQFPDPVHLYVL